MRRRLTVVLGRARQTTLPGAAAPCSALSPSSAAGSQGPSLTARCPSSRCLAPGPSRPHTHSPARWFQVLCSRRVPLLAFYALGSRRDASCTPHGSEAAITAHPSPVPSARAPAPLPGTIATTRIPRSGERGPRSCTARACAQWVQKTEAQRAQQATAKVAAPPVPPAPWPVPRQRGSGTSAGTCCTRERHALVSAPSAAEGVGLGGAVGGSPHPGLRPRAAATVRCGAQGNVHPTARRHPL